MIKLSKGLAAACLASLALFLGSCGEVANMELPSLAQAPYEADSGTLLVRCGRLIDGRADTSTEHIDVLIRDGRIQEICKNIITGEAVPVLDLSDYSCLPGLLEMHAHNVETID